MYGRDLGQKTFLENVYDDVVKAFFKHFASYIKNVSRSLTNYAHNIVIDSYHYDCFIIKWLDMYFEKLVAM